MSEVEEIAQSILDGLRKNNQVIPSTVIQCVDTVRSHAEGESVALIYAVADSLFETIQREAA